MVTQKELVILHKGVKDGQVKKVQLCKAGVRALLGQNLQECEGGAPESPWRPEKAQWTSRNQLYKCVCAPGTE